MKTPINILVVFFVVSPLWCQNYFGGNADGFASNNYNETQSIYVGGNADGFASSSYNETLNIFAGGDADGFATSNYNETLNIFVGGDADGFSMGSYSPFTYVPDNNFEQALIDLGYDSGVLDNYVLTANINTIVSLNISNKNIADFTGIEDFGALENLNISQNPITQSTTFNINNLTALRILNCSNSQLTSLDISDNTALTNLKCSNNQLANLDVTQNTALTQLWCHNNQLSSLDVSQNTVLSQLYCSTNSLTTLDVTQNTVLNELRCQVNSLTSIDVSQNTSLVELWCRDNQITSLDLSQNLNLAELICNNNQLTNFNIKNGNNTAITNANFNATNNPSLTCIEVDDAAYSIANWINIDAQTSFSTNCTADIQLSTKAYLQGAATNPNVGEETWMRDDLRVASLIPTTSPYTDALTVNASVFTPTGANAIVDWVWVELRDENDNTNILASTSALLQRDGDIVATDGISPINFSLSNGNYYVAVSHRNHLGILSANTFALSSTVSVVNLSNSFAVINGGINAVVDLGNGIFACYAGDFDGNDQIQNTDVNSVVSLLGNSGYSNADTDLNGQTQNTDINILINPNIGKGQQYLREQLNLYAKRRNND